MDKTDIPLMGLRQSQLIKSFNLAVRSLLTSCSKEDFSKSFSRFSSAEQESLHSLYIKVITSLHKMIEDEFKCLCLETQVGTALDTVEQLVEEQSLDLLSAEKANIMDVACDLSTAKKNEINHLMSMLERAEEHNRVVRARIEVLKKGSQDVSGSAEFIKKLRSEMLNYGTHS